jgi:AraC-like DNA-binding protein
LTPASSDWTRTTSAFCDRVDREAGGVALSSLPSIWDGLAEDLPVTPCPAEERVLRSSLLATMSSVAMAQHQSIESPTTGRFCVFDACSVVDRIFADRRNTIREAFVDAGTRLVFDLRDHQLCHEFAGRILLAPPESHSLSCFATKVGRSERALDQAFRSSFGMSPASFIRSARLLKAIESLVVHGEKVEVAALLSGWRSKKNFYRAAKKWFWFPPSAMRDRQFCIEFRSDCTVTSGFREATRNIRRSEVDPIKTCDESSRDVEAVLSALAPVGSQQSRWWDIDATSTHIAMPLRALSSSAKRT